MSDRMTPNFSGPLGFSRIIFKAQLGTGEVAPCVRASAAASFIFRFVDAEELIGWIRQRFRQEVVPHPSNSHEVELGFGDGASDAQ